MPVDAQRAVYRPHPRADRATHYGANRASGSIAFMRALLRTSYQPLSPYADRPRQRREKSNGQCKA